MKRLRSVLPFLAALFLLLGSVILARAIHVRSGDVYVVNTGVDGNGEVHTVRVFDSISSVVAIDVKNHSRKKKIALESVSYDRATSRLSFSEPLPFAETVIQVEGTSVQPEQFCVHDFDGTSDFLLVLLKDRVAIENYEYTFDERTRLVTFRSDIHPERDGNFHISYKNSSGAMHGFGSWAKKDSDRRAELEWQWLHKTQDAPMLVMKERNGASRRKLEKETGFSVRLPKGDSTFLVETMDGTEKQFSLMRWYDEADLLAECRKNPFEEPEHIEREESLSFKGISVTKRHILGTETDGNGEKQKEVPLVLYTWNRDGTFYQLTAKDGSEEEAERLLEKL